MWLAFANSLLPTIKDNSFLAYGSDTIWRYRDKINARTLTEKEYQRIMDEIAVYNSILPLTAKRNFSYGWWTGDVILSRTLWKMYCVERDSDREEFINDYKWKQYYTSRSGSSGEWFVIAWKKSIVYLPINRKDVVDPQNFNYTQYVNWLNLTARSDRWIVDKDYPVTIQYWENQESDIDFAFIDPLKVEELCNIITSWWVLPDSYQFFSHNLWNYINEQWQSQELIVTYLSEKRWWSDIINNILDRTGKLRQRTQSRLYYEETWSEFERVVWIYKSWDQYVRKWKFWLAKEMYWVSNPRFQNHKQLFEYVVWNWGLLEKEYYGDDVNFNCNGRRFFSENCVYRNDSNNPWKYTIMFEYDYRNLWLNKYGTRLLQRFNSNKVKPNSYNTYQDDSNNLSFDVTQAWSQLIYMINNVDLIDLENVNNIFLSHTKNTARQLFKNDFDSLAVSYTSVWKIVYDWWELLKYNNNTYQVEVIKKKRIEKLNISTASIGDKVFVRDTNFEEHVEADTLKIALELWQKRLKKRSLILTLNDVRNDRTGTAWFCLYWTKKFAEKKMPFLYNLIKNFNDRNQVPEDIMETEFHLADKNIFNWFPSPVY